MPHPLSDPGIPTLTQGAEPTLSPSSATGTPGTVPSYPDDAFPLLTEVADDDVPVLTDPAGGDDFPLLTDPAADDGGPLLTDAADDAANAGTTTPSAAPPPPILAARLQAEIEQVMRAALADAIARLQARMDEELPRIVTRVLRDIRPG